MLVLCIVLVILGASKCGSRNMALDKRRLVAGLRRILPAELIIDEPEALKPYECDGLSAYRQLPYVAVMPQNSDQIRQILAYCHSQDVPVVARGAGTGLSGGALPHAHGVLLSLAKLNRIIEINAQQAIATVEPGVRNLAISEAVAHLGLYYAPDPSSQIACTIGGNVAENSGGVHCLKYGLTVHNVKQVKMVTMEGELLTIGSRAMDSPGYDLLALVHGSEGLLGIVVEVTVQLLPRPAQTQVVLGAFDQIEKAAEAVAAVIAAGIIPAGLEMMDQLAIEAAEDFVHAGYPRDAKAILLCEVDGIEQEVSVRIQQVESIFKQCRATEVRVAADEAQRQKFWQGRKAAFPAVGRLSPDYYCMDGTIPRHHLPRVLARIDALSLDYGLSVANVFHAGDGNLHPLILYDANVEGELEKAERLGADILEECVAVGGTITGEHGVGIEKINQMCIQFAEAELQQFHRLKQAFDQKLLLNPGKAIPTLQRCAEFGAMHVHHGKTRFPHLERF